MAGERDRARGFFDRMKGRAKKVAGEITEDLRRKAGGSLDEAKGKLEEKKGEVKEDVTRKIEET